MDLDGMRASKLATPHTNPASRAQYYGRSMVGPSIDQPMRLIGANDCSTQAQAINAPISALEEQVLMLARYDRLSSVAAPPTWRRAIRGAIGFRPANRLADPHLEALRRYAVLSLLVPDHVDTQERRLLEDQGFTPSSIVAIDDRLRLVRQSRHATRWIAGWAAALAAAVGLFAWLRFRLDDPLIAAMLTVLLSLPFVILGAPRNRHVS